MKSEDPRISGSGSQSPKQAKGKTAKTEQNETRAKLRTKPPRKTLRPSDILPLDHEEYDEHEDVLAFFDAETGMRAIIAVHSTERGRAIGGCRMMKYDSTTEALADVLRLSRGMSYKCAWLDLPFGGAKSVIIHDPASGKPDELLAAFAVRVERMAGRYWTAEDANIVPKDVEVMARHTRYITGRREGPAPSGDPGPITARGVVDGIRVCAEQKFGSPDLRGRRIAIVGAGGVGSEVARLAAADGAVILIADKERDRAVAVANKFGGTAIGAEEIWTTDADILSPNAHGASITKQRAERLKVSIVAGAENNVLATNEPQKIGDVLHARKILYAPDYIINAGGLINCYAEVRAIELGEGFDEDWRDTKLADISANLREIFRLSNERNISPDRVADAEGRKRIGRD